MSTHDPAYSRCFGRGKISPLRFGQGLLTRPSSANAGLPAPNRGRVTWRPPAGRTAGCLETLAERNKFATKAAGIRGRSRPSLEPSRNKLDVLTSDLPKKSRTTVRYTSKLFLDGSFAACR